MVDATAASQETTGFDAVRLPLLMDDNVFMARRERVDRLDCDALGLVLAALIGTVPSGEIPPSNPLPIPAIPPPVPEEVQPAPQQPPPPHDVCIRYRNRRRRHKPSHRTRQSHRNRRRHLLLLLSLGMARAVTAVALRRARRRSRPSGRALSSSHPEKKTSASRC